MKIKLHLHLSLSLFLIGPLVIGCSSEHQDLLYDKKPAFYSYIFGDTNGNAPDKEHAADASITPASCQKTVTALLALKALGPDYTFETKLYTTRKNGDIQDVILSFSGDPTLTSQALEDLLKPLENKPIKGRLILDASVFKTPSHSTYNMISDLGTGFGQPVSPMNIDENLIHVTIKPGISGAKATLENDVGYPIRSMVMTTKDATAVKLFWNGPHLMATGTIKEDDQPLIRKISPIEIEDFVLLKMKRLLKSHKFQSLTNQILILKESEKLPAGKQLHHAVRSVPLKKLIPPALKISNNLVFDSLYLTIVHAKNPVGITDWSDGDPIIKDLIKVHFNMDMKGALFVDGSGLSRYNRIQPRQLFQLLQKGHDLKEFVDSLPKPGESQSTLEKRTTLPPGIRAKTGTLSGVSCLCGYGVQNHPSKTFVIVANSYSPPAKDVTSIIDEFVLHTLGDED